VISRHERHVLGEEASADLRRLLDAMLGELVVGFPAIGCFAVAEKIFA